MSDRKWHWTKRGKLWAAGLAGFQCAVYLWVQWSGAQVQADMDKAARDGVGSAVSGFGFGLLDMVGRLTLIVPVWLAGSILLLMPTLRHLPRRIER